MVTANGQGQRHTCAAMIYATPAMIDATPATKQAHSGLLERERRRVPRRAFGGAAEILVAHPATYFVGPVSELSMLGCFLRTDKILPVGATLTLKITHDDAEFNAQGKVVHVVPGAGIGVMFITADADDKQLPNSWLIEDGGLDFAAPVTARGFPNLTPNELLSSHF
jgi:hypothetical protein